MKRKNRLAEQLCAYARLVPTLTKYAGCTAIEAYERQARELAEVAARHLSLAEESGSAGGEMYRTAHADAARKAQMCQLLSEGCEIGTAVSSVLSPRAASPQSASSAQEKQGRAPKRIKANQPRRDGEFWLKAAEDLERGIAYKTKNPFPGKKLTPARRRDWQFRLDNAYEDMQWQGALRNLAEAATAGTLPEVLYGLTNATQVRNLMRHTQGGYQEQHGGPFMLGPTIRTVEQLREAASIIKSYVTHPPKLYVPETGDTPVREPPHERSIFSEAQSAEQASSSAPTNQNLLPLAA